MILNGARDFAAVLEERKPPEVLDAEWRPAEPEGIPLELMDHPQNVRGEQQQRARTWARMKRKIFSGLCGVSFLVLLGFTGSMDQGGDLGTGMAGMAASLGGMILFGTLAGIIEW